MAVIRMVKAGERRGVVDHRRRTRCAHEQGLQEEHTSRGKSDDAAEDILPERSRYHDNPVCLPFEAPGVSGEIADTPWPEEMTFFRYDNQAFRRNLATRQPECDVPPTGALLERRSLRVSSRTRRMGAAFSPGGSGCASPPIKSRRLASAEHRHQAARSSASSSGIEMRHRKPSGSK